VNASPEQSKSLSRYLAAALSVAACALLGYFNRALDWNDANTVMILLAGVAFVAFKFGHGPAVFAALSSVAVFDFFFVHPSFSLNSADAQYFVTLAVMLGIGILISELTARQQEQLRISKAQEQRTAELFRESQEQERRTSQLYQLTQKLSQLHGRELLLHTAAEQLGAMFAARVAYLVRQPDGSLRLEATGRTGALNVNTEIAKSVANLGAPAGLGTELSPNEPARYVPMIGSQTIGVLAVAPADLQRFANADECRMLTTCATLVALAAERDESLVEAQQAQVLVQAEQLRNSLLSSVSHDLRTPLAMIAVTASSLAEESAERPLLDKREMLNTLVDESQRLSRQVENLLDMARFQAGEIELNRDWHVIEELVGVALARLGRELGVRKVDVKIPADLPLVWVSEQLIEQVFINLLDNAARYTPKDSRLEIRAQRNDETIEIFFADNGPGLPSGAESKVFDKFFRGNTRIADGQRGIGLGLTICRSIVEAHGGKMRAGNRTEGGAEFVICLPCPQGSPQFTLEETPSQVELPGAASI
jgi:two-component system, OmpR family, sensor histidine kinase KdpD